MPIGTESPKIDLNAPRAEAEQHARISWPENPLHLIALKRCAFSPGISIVLPVELGSSRTRPPGVPPLYSILPMQILTNSFHHFNETVEGYDKITNFQQENDLEEMLLKPLPSIDHLPQGFDEIPNFPATNIPFPALTEAFVKILGIKCSLNDV
ncbi:hypothetical protein TNCV_2674491 [Trichonephila clavipes]|nr:hypothetical protein TNCV_2674491 [Trichonephila clavipes]